MSSPYEMAKKNGYSDEEILQYFQKKDPNFQEKYKRSLDAGYKPEEVFAHLGKKDVFAEKNKTENLSQNVGRQIGRTGARVAETVLGAPRAFGDFLQTIVPEKLITKGAEKIGLKEPVQKGFEFAKKFSPHKLFPSSEQIKENVTNYLFNDKLDPKNEWEKKSDELFSDFAALSIPFPGSQLKILKPSLLALGGNIASEVVGRMGGTDKEKTYTKLGTFLLGSIINPRGAEKFKNELYNKARQFLPEDATVSSVPLNKKIQSLEKELLKGGIADSDRPALEKLKDIQGEMQGAQIPVESLGRLKVKINEELAGIYKKLEGNKVGIKSAKRNLERVAGAVDEALTLYGKQNPEWEAYYRPANQVHGSIEQSKRVGRYLSRQYKRWGAPGALALFGIESALGIPKSAAIFGGGYGALKSGEIVTRFLKSPHLRKYYTNVVSGALRDDAVAVQQNLDRLEKEVKKLNQEN